MEISTESEKEHSNKQGASKCITKRHRNNGLVSSGVSLTSWGEGASLDLVGITIKIPYGVGVLLHRPALQPIFFYWVG